LRILELIEKWYLRTKNIWVLRNILGKKCEKKFEKEFIPGWDENTEENAGKSNLRYNL
jgi:hypothetical protein